MTTQYQTFRREVEFALGDVYADDAPSAVKVHHLLNGAASDALTCYVTRKVRAADGIFFSGYALATYVASLLKSRIQAGATVADPTCGAGDLLIACMALATRESNANETVKAWSTRVIGVDIHTEFAATARARLALLAMSKHRGDSPETSTKSNLMSSFANICQGDFFQLQERIGSADCIVMNPPFYEAAATNDCMWSSGKTQIAARFVEQVLQYAKPNQEIVAVLPDVLRSGSRYGRWRSQVEQRAKIVGTHVYGRFDMKTDVDVFVLHLIAAPQCASMNFSASTDWNVRSVVAKDTFAPTLKDLFDVSVGAVVPHRCTNTGKWFPYLSVANAPAGGEITGGQKKRFSGTVHQAPFVAIRRTSSPSDNHRIVATVVSGREYFAVENHLIVLQPLDRKLSTCRKLAHVLSQNHIKEWVNGAIRCRHLTTKTLKQLPLEGWEP